MPKQSDNVDVFRSRVSDVMSRRGLTITEVAASAGMDRAGLSRVLSGSEGLSIERAERIARFLKLELCDILNPKKKLK